MRKIQQRLLKELHKELRDAFTHTRTGAHTHTRVHPTFKTQSFRGWCCVGQDRGLWQTCAVPRTVLATACDISELSPRSGCCQHAAAPGPRPPPPGSCRPLPAPLPMAFAPSASPLAVPLGSHSGMQNSAGTIKTRTGTHIRSHTRAPVISPCTASNFMLMYRCN